MLQVFSITWLIMWTIDMNEHHVYPGACAELLPILERLDVKQLALFKGKTSFGACDAWNRLQLQEVKCNIIDHTVKEGLPNVESLKQAEQFLAKHRPDVLLAVGGGSVIDTAKAARAMLTIDNLKQQGWYNKPICIAVPTTAGTGSEATPFASFYEGFIKQSMDRPDLLPEISIVDSNLVHSLTDYQMACSGVDALCQSIESTWAQSATQESSDFAWQSLTLISEHLNDAIHFRKAPACEAMAKAAHLSGKAIAISRTTAPHAFSYWLTAKYQIPHGHAVGIFMGPILQLHSNRQAGISHELLNLQQKILDLLGLDDNNCILCQWRSHMKAWGLDATLGQLNIPVSAIDEILMSVNQKRLVNHPVAIDNQILRSTLTHSSDMCLKVSHA